IAAKAVDALKGAQESFLRQVARFFRIVREPKEQRINIARLLGYQPLVSCRFTTPQSFKELILRCRTEFESRCRSNRFNIGMPSEGHLLSVAHSASPCTGSLKSDVRGCFSDRHSLRQPAWPVCSQ